MMILLGLVACATTTTQVSRKADPNFARKVVTYPTPVRAGAIVVDPGNHFLYLVQGDGQAIRYGVGLGGEGRGPKRPARRMSRGYLHMEWIRLATE